jgi:hypothetical protein
MSPRHPRLSDYRTVADDAAGMDDHGPRSRWHAQVLIAVAITVATTLALVLLTPISDWLKEIVAPTHAEITGVVKVGKQELANARVRVDGLDAVRTDTAGRFQVGDVSDGEHRLRVSKLGVVTRVTRARVDRGQNKVDVGTIRVDPAVRLLGHDRTRTVSQGFDWVRQYDIALWITADNSLRDEIREVRYEVPEPLASSSLKGTSSGHIFCAVVRRSLPMDQWIGGNEPVTARVRLRNGRSLVVSDVEPRARRPRVCG